MVGFQVKDVLKGGCSGPCTGGDVGLCRWEECAGGEGVDTVVVVGLVSRGQ